MLSCKSLLAATLAVIGVALPSQAATIINFSNADGGDNGANPSATSVDLGTVSVARDPAMSGDGDSISSLIYTVSDPLIGGDIEVTVSLSGTTTLDSAGGDTRFEIGRLVAGQSLTLTGAITSTPANISATFLGFSEIDFTSLSGGEDTTVTSGAVTSATLDSGASSDVFDLTTIFGGPVGTFTLDHVGSAGNTGSWGLRDFNFAIDVTVPEPSSFAMLGLGGLVTLVRRRKR